MARTRIDWLTIGTRHDGSLHIVNDRNDPGAACCTVARLLSYYDLPRTLLSRKRHEFKLVKTVLERTAPDGTVSHWEASGSMGAQWFLDAKGAKVVRVSPTLVAQYRNYFN
jgi:hypothetical protein